MKLSEKKQAQELASRYFYEMITAAINAANKPFWHVRKTK